MHASAQDCSNGVMTEGCTLGLVYFLIHFQFPISSLSISQVSTASAFIVFR